MQTALLTQSYATSSKRFARKETVFVGEASWSLGIVYLVCRLLRPGCLPTVKGCKYPRSSTDTTSSNRPAWTTSQLVYTCGNGLYRPRRELLGERCLFGRRGRLHQRAGPTRWGMFTNFLYPPGERPEDAQVTWEGGLLGASAGEPRLSASCAVGCPIYVGHSCRVHHAGR